MKIALFETNESEEEYFRQKFPTEDLMFFDQPLTCDFKQNLNQVEVISVFIYSKISPKIISKMPNLKLIVARSTGFDHIDVDACREQKITVCNVPSYGENTVAEHTFALILALSRKIVPSVERTKQGNFVLDGLRGSDLNGKTIAILGTGKIGMSVARIAQGFGMKLLGYDIYQNEKLAKELGLKYVSLEDALASADIISLNLRHTTETHHLINKNSIKQIKKGAILVNTARGGLIDTPALLDALDKSYLSGVGLDVLEEEITIKEDMQIISKHFPKRQLMLNVANNILLRRPNVIITPHNAFNSDEAFQRILDTTVENVLKFKSGNPVNIVSEN